MRVNYAAGETIWCKNIDGTDDGGASECTPGVRRQAHHHPCWSRKAPSDAFGLEFANTVPGKTLGPVVQLGGPSALGRHTVAAPNARLRVGEL